MLYIYTYIYNNNVIYIYIYIYIAVIRYENLMKILQARWRSQCTKK